MVQPIWYRVASILTEVVARALRLASLAACLADLLLSERCYSRQGCLYIPNGTQDSPGCTVLRQPEKKGEGL